MRNSSIFFMAAVAVGSASAAQAQISDQPTKVALLAEDGALPEVYKFKLPPQADNFSAEDLATGSEPIIVEAKKEKYDNPTSVQDNSGIGFDPFQTKICGSLKFFKKGAVIIKADACAFPPVVVTAGPKISYVPNDGIFPKFFGKHFLTSSSLYVFHGKEFQGKFNSELRGFVAELGVGGLGFNIGRMRIEPGVAVGCATALYEKMEAFRKYGIRNKTNCRVAPIVSVAFQRGPQ